MSGIGFSPNSRREFVLQTVGVYLTHSQNHGLDGCNDEGRPLPETGKGDVPIVKLMIDRLRAAIELSLLWILSDHRDNPLLIASLHF